MSSQEQSGESDIHFKQNYNFEHFANSISKVVLMSIPMTKLNMKMTFKPHVYVVHIVYPMQAHSSLHWLLILASCRHGNILLFWRTDRINNRYNAEDLCQLEDIIF